MRKQSIMRWGGYWWYPKQALARNKVGATHHMEHFLFDNCEIVTKRTRIEMRKWIADKYGYIKDREDLRTFPHFWRVPKAVRIKIEVRAAESSRRANEKK